ncbi:hypothetical protein Trydic_g120 [Trypoxylus dichotomus]
MGSLAPVIANFYMEFLESRALDTAVQKPLCWYRYVDDTFVVWRHSIKLFVEVVVPLKIRCGEHVFEELSNLPRKDVGQLFKGTLDGDHCEQ